MKKITLLMLCIAAFASMANASTYFYVDPTGGSDANDGLTWTTAKQTIPAAWTLAQTNAGWDNIMVKGGIISLSSAWAVGASENYYGSCKGDETSPTERPLTDKDGNGILEPWEFEFPTKLDFNINANALSLPNSAINFNGFTISHTGTSLTGSFRSITLGNPIAAFANNTISNCNLTVAMPSASIASVLMKAFGNVSNCLIEKNTVNVIAKYDGSLYLVEAAVATVVPGTKISNCVFRNNKITTDYSTGISTNGNARGLILHISPGTVTGISTTVSNCLIYNNEAVYVANATKSSMNNGSIVAMNNTANGSDSIVNCTIANNKGTLISCAGLNVISIATTSHNVINNVCWNNQNNGILSNINGTITIGSINNNIVNDDEAVNQLILKNNGTTILNNDSTLSASNTGGSAPQFKTPTSIVGNTTDNSSELSNWTLNSGSYLVGKGIVTTRLNDKSGNSFAIPRAVGAYENAMLSAVNSPSENGTNVFLVTNKGFISKVQGTIQVYSFTGKTILSTDVSCGQEIVLPSGAYVIRLKEIDSVSVCKVVI